MLDAQWTQWAVWLMVALALFLLIWPDWRGLIVGLAVLEAALVAVLLQVWSLPLAATQLIAGWLAGAMLAIAQNLRVRNEAPPPLTGRLVRFLAGVLTLALVFSSSPALAQVWPAVPGPVRLGGATVALLGIMQTAWSRHPLRLTIGLLTALSGFLALYAWQQQGLLLTGLLAMFQVLVAWAGSYLIHQIQTLAGEDAL